jgi:hypothetical protein
VVEIHEIISNAPRMTLGVQELSESVFAAQYRLETPETLAGQLIGLVSKIPAADPLSDRIFEMAFGMRFGPVRDFLREKAAAIVNDPYQCEHLADMNDSAADALVKLEQPMPPFLNNFQGVRASIREIVMNQDAVPENALGLLAIHVEQPQMLVGMAQMLVPDLSSLPIRPGEPPVRLPEQMIPVPGLVTYAAMSDHAIGLSLGEGEQEGLADYLDQKAGPEGMFLSTSYDMAAYLEYSGKLDDFYQPVQGAEDDENPAHAAIDELRQAAATAMKQMADRSETNMSFTPEGLVIDSRTSFK